MLIIGLYLGISINWVIGISFISLIMYYYKKLPKKIARIIVFFLIGCFRGLIENAEEVYTYRYTSFEAEILDYRLRENRNYLLLTNFKYKKKHSVEYKLDEFSSFPKEALMEIENIENYYNAKRIEGIGRFYIPLPIAQAKAIISKANGNDKRGKARGVIKNCHIITKKHSSFKHYLREKFKKHLSSEASNFSASIFLSDTFAISKENRKIFEKAGLAHVLGVSILNLTIILMILFYIFYYIIGKVYLRSTYFLPLYVSSQLCSLASIILYCYLIGFEYPLVRTLFMSGISIILLFFTKANQLENLFLSACMILLIEPNGIYDLSFQLSFGGVLGIYALRDIKFNNKILSSMWTTISAMSLIGPISIYQFQQICLQPFLSNLIILPMLNFIIIPSLLMYIILPNIICKYLAYVINFEFELFQKTVIFLSKTAQNMHFLPLFDAFFIVFLAFFLIFSIIQENIRYYILIIGYMVFGLGVFIANQHKPFLLVNMSSIGLVLKDKIIVYPKSGVMGELWSEYYHLPCFDGENSGYFKNDNEKIIVKGIGIIRKEPNGLYSLPTKKDYVFLSSEIMNETQIIKLDE